MFFDFSYLSILIIFHYYIILVVFFFFFQAEDGIRDVAVTGVQTCALPIRPESEHSHLFPIEKRTSSNLWTAPRSRSCPTARSGFTKLSSMATALLVSNRIVVQCCFLGGTSPSTIIIHTLSTPLASFQKAQWLMEKSSRSTNQAVQALICSKSGCAMHRCGSFTLSLIFSSATIVISPDCP